MGCWCVNSRSLQSSTFSTFIKYQTEKRVLYICFISVRNVVLWLIWYLNFVLYSQDNKLIDNSFVLDDMLTLLQNPLTNYTFAFQGYVVWGMLSMGMVPRGMVSRGMVSSGLVSRV